jgi:protein gp37
VADGTHIEWTDATWNIINGCSVKSPGCANCYAMKLAGTRLKHIESRKGLTIDTKAGPVWTGKTRFNDKVLLDPIKWKRPRKIFVCAHGDLFHDSVPDEWIDKVFAVMALAPQHQFQVLTKRSKRMREYINAFDQRPDAFGEALALVTRAAGLQLADGLAVIEDMHWPLPNVWLGVSVEDQTRADERIPDLLATPAAVRWISAEPLLGMVDMRWAMSHPLDIAAGFLKRGRFSPGLETLRPIDWVVGGGESGPGSRPMHPAWIRSIRDHCQGTGTQFLFKQWGAWRPSEACPIDCKAHAATFDTSNNVWRTSSDGGWIGDQSMCHVGKKAAGRVLDGVTHDGYPL